MRVLVVGKGGREHALIWKLRQSSLVDEIFCTQGNAGICELAECIDVSPEDIEGIIGFSKNVDFIVVGPENPLALGIVNELPKKTFGPTKEGALIEADKSFARELMKKTGVCGPKFKITNDYRTAVAYLDEIEYPHVIKASGLAFGKGSFIVHSKEEAQKVLKELMVEHKLGEAGSKVVFEEYLEGTETSFFVLTDGKEILPLVTAHDYKRLLDNDEGPNTGGMGSYAPHDGVVDIGEIINKIIEPTLWYLKREGVKYKGVLYAGLMLTKEGPKVLEFNCRFGDPETQPIMLLLESDLLPALIATVEENLKEIHSLKWRKGFSVCVIAASKGYPGTYEKGKEISGLSRVKNAVVFHSGTKKVEDKILTNGGRVLGITAYGNTLESASQLAYNELQKIYFDGIHYRKDIGKV